MDDDGCRISMPGGVEVEAAVAHYCETLTDASSPASLAQDNILMGMGQHETRNSCLWTVWSYKYMGSMYPQHMSQGMRQF